jgi:UDP-N-acetylglucosamine 2-epimerase (non-hydrolysing)
MLYTKTKFLFVFGTRPEAIKLTPLIKKLLNKDEFDVKVCVTGQHRKMLDQVLEFFEIKVDFDLNLMKPDQTLADITGDALKGVYSVIENNFRPDYVIVQGDTTTAMVGALAGFYAKIKVIHIEAGLRSGDKYSPFPEEMNRILIGRLCDMHFTPTATSYQNLVDEGVDSSRIWDVGNTVIDALLMGLENIRKCKTSEFDNYYSFIGKQSRIVLVTGHRRENFGEPFENICHALISIADANPDVEIVYPVHLNPNVQTPVNRLLKGHKRIHLIEPLEYPKLIWLLERSYIVITDSGGIQEEAPALGKPVLVMRDVTERMEGVIAGTAKLVGTDKDRIIREANILLKSEIAYSEMAKAVNPYGDGTTGDKIVKILTDVINYKKIKRAAVS